jgi:hypothetical protein
MWITSKEKTMIDQLPFWCRECGATYESLNDDGVCTICNTPNVLGLHLITVTIPAGGYTAEEARASVEALVDRLIKAGAISSETVVSLEKED